MLGYPAGFGHNSFALNGQLNTDGTLKRSGIDAAVTIDERRVNPAFRDVRDPYHLTQGGQLGRVHKNFLVLQIGGRIYSPKASQKASLAVMERTLMAAFDPALCLRDSPSTQGAYPFTFREPTTDTATYAGGIMDLQYWMRPLDAPRVVETIGEGGTRTYGLALIAPDPRAYEQTEQTLALTPGSPSGAVVNRGTVPAPLKATIVTSAAGAANFTITRAGVSFVLDLSGMGAATVIVIFETCAPYGVGKSITKAGVSQFIHKTSNAASWLDVPVGSTSFAISNTTNLTSCTLAWYSARA